jgi:hypothetical protein
MASVDYQLLQGWMGGGLTWNYYLTGINERYYDVWVSPAPGYNSSGNLEILRKWMVMSPAGDQLWFELRNNTPQAVNYWINVVYIGP